MSIQNAINFIERAPQDDALRRACYSCKDGAELRELLGNEGFKFDEEEFENACNMLHIKCADEHAAYNLHQIKSWYLILSLR
ncbi:MAG: Nif11-like leader peptide family natural product precursor [Rikenellaceae bacterium]